MPDPRHALGQRAEQMAATWLASRGWTILARRWRCPDGELDLVARDPDGLLVAIEVKGRRSTRAGGPLESIDQRRLRRLRAALGRFLAEQPSGGHAGLRIDLLAVWRDEDGRWLLGHHPAIDAW
jgi:putative endonuclease